MIHSNKASSEVVLTAHAGEQSIGRDFLIGEKSPQPSQLENVHLGYLKKDEWIRVTLKNPTDSAISRWVYFDGLTGFLDLYKNEKGQLKLVLENGTSKGMNARTLASILTAFPIKIEPHSKEELIFKIRSRHNFNSKIYLGSIDDIKRRELSQNQFLDLYTGGILALILYNLLIFLSLRERSYLYYCFFTASFALAVLNINGVLDRLFPHSPLSPSHYLICFSSLALFSASLFTSHFLKIKIWLPKFYWFYNSLLVFTAILFFVGLTELEDRAPFLFGNLIDLLIVVGNLAFLINSIQLSPLFSSARFYLASWVIILLSLIIWFGMMLAIFPKNAFTENALLLGNILQMITLSLALANQIRNLRAEKRLAEMKAIEKENYQRLVRVLSHDLSNSLTIMSSYATKLSYEIKDHPIQHKFIQKIIYASENIKSILDNVRIHYLLPHSRDDFEVSLINLRAVLKDSSEIFDEQLAIKNITLSLDIPDEQVILINRSIFLNNIVSNIISNSIKFSNENTTIHIWSTIKNDEIKIHFRDQGRGIGADKIREIFYSNNLTSTRGTQNEEGSGLGTKLMREYLYLYSGSLFVESIEESLDPIHCGTTITLSFPLYSQESD